MYAAIGVFIWCGILHKSTTPISRGNHFAEHAAGRTGIIYLYYCAGRAPQSAITTDFVLLCRQSSTVRNHNRLAGFATGWATILDLFDHVVAFHYLLKYAWVILLFWCKCEWVILRMCICVCIVYTRTWVSYCVQWCDVQVYPHNIAAHHHILNVHDSQLLYVISHQMYSIRLLWHKLLCAHHHILNVHDSQLLYVISYHMFSIRLLWHKLLCVWVGLAENRAERFPRSLTLEVCIEVFQTPYFQRENWTAFVFALQTPSQTTLWDVFCTK